MSHQPRRVSQAVEESCTLLSLHKRRAHSCLLLAGSDLVSRSDKEMGYLADGPKPSKVKPEKGGTKARVHVVNSRRGRVKCRSDRFCRLRIAFHDHRDHVLGIIGIMVSKSVVGRV